MAKPLDPMTHTPRKFTLGDSLTDEQLAYFADWGYLHFEAFASLDEVEALRGGMKAVQAQWLDEGREKINGIPIKWGQDVGGDKMVQRFAFTSQFSPAFHDFQKSVYLRSLPGA